MNFNKLKLDKDQKEDLVNYIEDMNNPFAFENYCGACNYFGDRLQCPYFDFVHAKTKWQVFGCKNFWD